jgi:hypothetical protein
MRPNKTTSEACRILGGMVRFVLDDEGVPIRATLDRRWVTEVEWQALLAHNLSVAPVMVPAPERSRREKACPCPGCRKCCCEWVGTGIKQCKRERCVCPRIRPPVRLEFRRISQVRAELELMRGDTWLYTLAVWTASRGWDFSMAGAAKVNSLPAVLAEVVNRAGTAFARSTLPPPALEKAA